MKTKKANRADEPTQEEMALTPMTNAMFDAARAEILRRNLNKRSPKLLLKIARELFPRFDKIAATEIMRAKVEIYMRRKVETGEMIHLHGSNYMNAKAFFALPYEEQQKRLHPKGN